MTLTNPGTADRTDQTDQADQTDQPDRLAERAGRRRPSRTTMVLALLGALAVAAGAGWLVLGSSVFGVDTVRVTGASRVSADEVRAAARIRAGTPLARLDTGAVARRVSGLSAVRDVEVRRTWPRTVTVVVRERVPAGVQARGSSWVLVDRGGVAFATEDRRPRGLPVVSAPVEAGAPALRAALQALDDLPVEVRGQVREVRAATVEQVTMRLSRGRTVMWGSSERGERKAAVLAVLLSRRASIYDVSAPDTPTTRR